jgi:hypothetical protein
MKKIIGYKAFDKDMKCNGFQFKEGKTYTHKGEVKLCQAGFHFCENPLDILNYYDLVDGNHYVVECYGVSDEKGDDSKRVAKKIKIGIKLDLPAFIKASIDFVFNSCKDKKDGEVNNGNSAKLASSGDNAQLASSGYYVQLASSGDNAKLASSGDNAQLASSGDNAQLASSGDNAKLASSGDNAKLASSGYYAQLASSGDNAKLASSGDNAQLASSGYHAQLTSTGEDAVIAGIGINNIVRGKKGSWITLAEYKQDANYNWKPVCVKSAQIDGKKIKEDTWYKLENAEFVEVI